MALKTMTFQKHYWKTEKMLVNQHFLLFPIMFSTDLRTNPINHGTFDASSANTFSLGEFKILSSGKEIQKLKFKTLKAL